MGPRVARCSLLTDPPTALVTDLLINYAFATHVNKTGVDPVNMLSMAATVAGLAFRAGAALSLLWRHHGGRVMSMAGRRVTPAPDPSPSAAGAQ